MPRRIARRKRIFFACEGESEQSYGTLLDRLIEQDGRLHIEAVIPHGAGGDPLSIVERSVRFLQVAKTVAPAIWQRPSYSTRTSWAKILKGIVRSMPWPIGTGCTLFGRGHATKHFLCVMLRVISPYDRPPPRKPVKDLSPYGGAIEGAATALLSSYIGLDGIALACKEERELRRFLQSINYFS